MRCNICGLFFLLSHKCDPKRLEQIDKEQQRQTEKDKLDLLKIEKSMDLDEKRNQTEYLKTKLIIDEEKRIMKNKSQYLYCGLCDVTYNRFTTHRHYKNPKFTKMEKKINNLENYIQELEKLMVSHIVDDIKDMIDDINTKNRKIVKKMDLLTEAEKDEVINYLAETNQPIFNSS